MTKKSDPIDEMELRRNWWKEHFDRHIKRTMTYDGSTENINYKLDYLHSIDQLVYVRYLMAELAGVDIKDVSYYPSVVSGYYDSMEVEHGFYVYRRLSVEERKDFLEEQVKKRKKEEASQRQAKFRQLAKLKKELGIVD